MNKIVFKSGHSLEVDGETAKILMQNISQQGGGFSIFVKDGVINEYANAINREDISYIINIDNKK